MEKKIADQASDLTVLILAAGKGSRMKSGLHKALHSIGGRSMLAHCLDMLDTAASTARLSIKRHIIVGDKSDQIRQAFSQESFIDQPQQRGTGDAVKAALPVLSKTTNDILVLFADTPLIRPETLLALLDKRLKNPDCGVVILGFETATPYGYGRLLLDNRNQLHRIIEEKDASPAEKAITLCNSGVMLIDGRKAASWLETIQPNQSTGEYYLTDLVAIAMAQGCFPCVVKGQEKEMAGVNSRADLARVEGLYQERCREKVMIEGVTLIAPQTVWLCYDTVLEEDVLIEPGVIFGPGVKVESGAVIKAHSYLEGCAIRRNATIGPFARIRPGSDIGEMSKIGNFVEIKKSVLSKEVKVSHLSYIGDALIGENTNIGAGTITCNYDGYQKFETAIGKNSFIGSNTALVAPVTIGDDCIIGAGSTITKDVAAGALALTRPDQINRDGSAEKFRERYKK